MGLVTSPPEAWEDFEKEEDGEPPVVDGYDARKYALLTGLVGRMLRGKLGLGKFRQEVVTKKLLD